MTKNYIMCRIFPSILIAIGLLAWMSWATPAQAHMQATGYSINLTYSGPTNIALGNLTGSFYADFHYTNIPSNGEFVSLFVDSRSSYEGSITSRTSNEDQYYFSDASGLTIGQHQLQARYFLTTTSSWIVSNTITITVGKGHSNIYCGIENLTYTYLPGKNVTIPLNVTPASGSGPVDWQNGTFTIKFSGPSTVTYANLKANTNEQVIVMTPHTPGQYQVICTFNGSPTYAGSSYSVAALVSEQNQTGAIQLYTNPTTVRANQFTSFYVVIPARNGLPTPTGSFDIIIGTASTRPIQLNASGAALVKLYAPATVNSVIILYFGDAVYASESPAVTITNSPIPTSGGTTPTPGPISTPMPTATAVATASPTPMPADGVPQIGKPTVTAHSSTPNVLLIVFLSLLGVAAVAGGGVLLIRR